MISVYLVLYPASAATVGSGCGDVTKIELVLERERYSMQGETGEVNVVEVPKV